MGSLVRIIFKSHHLYTYIYSARIDIHIYLICLYLHHWRCGRHWSNKSSIWGRWSAWMRRQWRRERRGKTHLETVDWEAFPSQALPFLPSCEAESWPPCALCPSVSYPTRTHAHTHTQMRFRHKVETLFFFSFIK